MDNKGSVRKDFSYDPQLKQYFHVKTSMAEAVLHSEELQQELGSSQKLSKLPGV